MADPIATALRGISVSVRTSMSVAHLRSATASAAASARVQDCIVPIVTIHMPGRPDRVIKLPRHGSKPPAAQTNRKPPLGAVDRAVILAAAGRTRVDMSVHGRRSAFDTAADVVKRRISAAVSYASTKKDFIRRFEAAVRKPQRDQSVAQLSRFFTVHLTLREADVVDCFRTVRREAVVRGVLDS